MADVYEGDIDKIRIGQSAVIGMPSDQGRSFAARVDYIQPQLDAMTRTLKIRLEAPNPNQRLKPEMFVDVDFHIGATSRLTVPAEAVLDAGIRKTVFVDRGDGYLEPRAVEIGDHFGDRIEIRSGLRANERIVTSGTFLIDSESQLKSAAGGMAGHQHGGAQSTPAKAQPDHSKMPGMGH
jgi:Cu(I)/Ag(I) efflux system membrane fusion protein